jgi:6-pyruvoyltetrahydropterin/6-carboxytetrahydropterin synthase
LLLRLVAVVGLEGGMQVRVTRAVEFSSSLRYWLGDLSDAENRARFGREAGQHGHNYRLEVTLCGEPDPVTGMVINLSELKQVLEAEVMSRFDHRDLNSDCEYFEKCPPTPENLALVLFEILESALPGQRLERIRLHADADTFVDVLGDGARAGAR